MATLSCLYLRQRRIPIGAKHKIISLPAAERRSRPRSTAAFGGIRFVVTNKECDDRMTIVGFSLSDTDLKEIFELFSSCSKDELTHVYNRSSSAYFELTDLDEEYELTQPKREFAVDAVRGVLAFLSRRGYRLDNGEKVVALDNVADLFI